MCRVAVSYARLIFSVDVPTACFASAGVCPRFRSPVHSCPEAGGDLLVFFGSGRTRLGSLSRAESSRSMAPALVRFVLLVSQGSRALVFSCRRL
jgi:hypothetical protein